MRAAVRFRRRLLRRLLKGLEILSWAVAALLLGAYALVYLDRSVYQAYESWSFDRKLEHKAAPVLGFLPHAFSAENRPPRSSDPPDAFAAATPPSRSPHGPRLPEGALIGRIEIPSVGIEAMVVNGTADSYLSRAVGHIEGTAMPGTPGNVGLAGHRDTFFRGLKRIRKGDIIEIRTLEGSHRYVVNSLSIVGPDDTRVLEASSGHTLTLVTCYPFDYVGAAPRRFVVGAREITGPGGLTQPPPQGS